MLANVYRTWADAGVNPNYVGEVIKGLVYYVAIDEPYISEEDLLFPTALTDEMLAKTLPYIPEIKFISIQQTSITAEGLAEFIRGDLELIPTKIEVQAYLPGSGFPHNLTEKSYRKLGVKTLGFLRRSPYLLVTYDGCGFQKLDASHRKTASICSASNGKRTFCSMAGGGTRCMVFAFRITPDVDETVWSERAGKANFETPETRSSNRGNEGNAPW